MSGLARKGSLGEAYQPGPPGPSDDDTLNVALYPYVPSLGSFVAAVEALWKERSFCNLEWCFYDPYHEEPPPNLDVFAFDCIYADDLLAAGKVEPIPKAAVAGFEDLMPFARENAATDSTQNALAGIPYLGCMSVLYYRADDEPLSETRPLTITALRQILGKAGYPGPEPPNEEGLLVDLAGKTTDACLYANRWRSQNNAWWPKPIPTAVPPPLENLPLNGLRAYVEMAGTVQAEFEDPGYERVNWFAEGKGRALVGLTETMSGWNPEVLENLAFVPLPMSFNTEEKKVMVYSDAIGIRPGLVGEKHAAALELANLVASEEVGRIISTSNGSNAQYLTPTRASTLQRLTEAPQIGLKYEEIARILLGGGYEPVSYRLGKGVRQWAPQAGAKIYAELFKKPPLEPEARPRRHHGFERTPAGLWRRER